MGMTTAPFKKTKKQRENGVHGLPKDSFQKQNASR